jgi:hypothetical protein
MQTTVEIDGKTLIIKLPLQKAVPSSTGKTLVIASTHGTVATEAFHAGKRCLSTSTPLCTPVGGLNRKKTGD